MNNKIDTMVCVAGRGEGTIYTMGLPWSVKWGEGGDKCVPWACYGLCSGERGGQEVGKSKRDLENA